MKILHLHILEAESKINTFCEQRIPPHVKALIQLTYKIRGNSITLYENRPPWKEGLEWSMMAVAQFRYDEIYKVWRLYYADRNSKWQVYPVMDDAKRIEDLIEEVDKDPICVFWG